MTFRIVIGVVMLAAMNIAFAAPDDAVAPGPADAYQVAYSSNLLIGDGYINITNNGSRGAYDVGSGGVLGGICVNVFTFDPSEEMVSCCACYVSPDGLKSLSVRQDLISNTLTPGVLGSAVIKLVATNPVEGTLCDASIAPGTMVQFSNIIILESGLRAWATSLHQNTTNGSYQMTENKFQVSALSVSEQTKLFSYCSFIRAMGSGYGICKSCRLGGLGGSQQ